MRNLKCVECGQTEDPMLVFVKALQYEDGTIEDLPEGMHPYCEPCRRKLNISDELNPGRDLRAEARQVVLDAVEAAKAATDKHEGIDAIYDAIDSWVGGTDSLFAMMGRPAPPRPDAVFDGVSDALLATDPTELTPTHILALLTITNTVKSRIPGRADFYRRAHEHLSKTDPHEVDGMLKGLE